MKKRYSSPMTKTIVVTSSPILQGSRVYTDDPQDVGAALVKKNPTSYNVWDDDWSTASE